MFMAVTEKCAFVEINAFVIVLNVNAIPSIVEQAVNRILMEG